MLSSRAAIAENQEPQRPNIVMILADDLGIECLRSYGGTSYKTPHLDRLASQGIRFTHCFSDPYCSPSRAQLLTGRYPFRNGIREVLFDLRRHADITLDPEREPSFARQLQQAGYRTAIAGKWQLSFLHLRDTVRDFGFDEYCCWQIFRKDGTKTRRYHRPHYRRNGFIVAETIKDRYGPDVLVDFLIDFMKRSVAAKRPFLAYHTCLLPHFPWVPTPDSLDQRDPLFSASGRGKPKFFPDMVGYLDKNVGRIMQALDALGIAENTVLIFTGDNGTQGPLRSLWGPGKTIVGGKGTMTDRGTRVPLLVRWPGRIESGATCDDLVDLSDFLPTLCELARAPLPKQTIDGRSFVPQLLGKAGVPREWVHVQDKSKRHVRSRDYILNDRGELRAVTRLGEPDPEPLPADDKPAVRQKLQAVLDRLR
jgi:arylsulfatase A